jgi:hypothetical protein
MSAESRAAIVKARREKVLPVVFQMNDISAPNEFRLTIFFSRSIYSLIKEEITFGLLRWSNFTRFAACTAFLGAFAPRAGTAAVTFLFSHHGVLGIAPDDFPSSGNTLASLE